MEPNQIEEQSKLVFILKRSDDSLKNVESYLRNRKWSVQSASDIKTALVAILQNRPRFVLISVEHPNPKTQILPKVLTQALNCHVIPYAETVSPLILSKLTAEHSLTPPVSGPSVDRMLSAIILKENETAASTIKFQIRGSSKSQNDSQHIVSSGRHSLGNDAIAVKGANEALQQLLSEEGVKEPIGVLAHLETSKAKTDIIIQKGVSGLMDPHLDQALPKKSDAQLREAEFERSVALQTKMETAKAEYNTVLVQGSKSALEKTVINEANPSIVQSLAVTTNVACIIVHSVRYSGYLVVALGKNKKIEDSFIRTLKQHLFNFLREKGEQLTTEDQLQLRLEPVEFQFWAIEQAEFLRKSIHKGSDVAIAFFPHDQVQIPFKNSFNPVMLALDIEKIKGDVQTEFDLYLHMPVNNKYLLYTPKGGVFYSTQKKRLLDRSIKQLHLRKDSVPDVKKYMAQNYLNEKIDQFNTAAAFQRKPPLEKF